MYKYAIACLLIMAGIACKNDKVSLSGDSPVEMKDFMEAFPTVALPFKIADSNMVKLADTTRISYPIFTEFIPDTVLTALYGKNAKKMLIHPVAKIEKEQEIYLLANLKVNGKTALFVFLFNNENKYISRYQLLSQQVKDEYARNVAITSEPTFIISREKTNSAGDFFYTRNGVAYNNGSGSFITVMSDNNEDLKKINEIINPIDTLPHKNKLSGDYVKDKRNFISLRDGNNNKYIFFIHFEKNGGDCIGELKGNLTMRDATHGYFQESGDPCVIDFVFTGKSVSVKEQGNCGNHRGIKCFFDDAYNKIKDKKMPSRK